MSDKQKSSKTEDRDDQIVKEHLNIGSGRTEKLTDLDVVEYAAAGRFDIEDGAGVYVGAGLGHKQTQQGSVEAQFKGPNVGAGIEFGKDFKVMAKADVVSTSVTSGPVTATVGLSADTGGSIGRSGVEAKVLGTGFSIGRKVGFSVLGTGFEIKLW